MNGAGFEQKALSVVKSGDCLINLNGVIDIAHSLVKIAEFEHGPDIVGIKVNEALEFPDRFVEAAFF